MVIYSQCSSLPVNVGKYGKMVKMGFTDSKEKSFENVEGGQTDDGYVPILQAYL